MFWSCASLDVSLIRIHLISIFFFPTSGCLLAWWGGLDEGLFLIPTGPALLFFFSLFFSSRACFGFFFPSVFSSVAISCPGFDIFCLFFPVTILCSVVFFFLFFFSFLWSCVLCRGYMCCVYSYSIILVIMNMGCRSIMCMIGYCHCQFVREGGGKTGWATGGPVFDAPTLGVAEGW